MADSYQTAINAILSTFTVAWNANTPAVTLGAAPVIVYEDIERDLKPHPSDSTVPWTRIIVRHSDSNKVTLASATGMARYRRVGIAWVQVYVPFVDGTSAPICRALASVARLAFEGKRALSGELVYDKTAVIDRAAENAFLRRDVKVEFHWDEII